MTPREAGTGRSGLLGHCVTPLVSAPGSCQQACDALMASGTDLGVTQQGRIWAPPPAVVSEPLQGCAEELLSLSRSTAQPERLAPSPLLAQHCPATRFTSWEGHAPRVRNFVLLTGSSQGRSRSVEPRCAEPRTPALLGRG